jgi:hypothetical protein
MNEKNYYNFNNRFIIKKIKIGPLTSKLDIDCKIIDFQDIEMFNTENVNGDYHFKTSFKEVHDHIFDVDYYFYKIEIIQKIKISSDINLSIYNREIKLNSWINLFFLTLENFIYIISSSKHHQNFQISNLKKKKRKRTITRDDFFNNYNSPNNNIVKNAFSMSTPKMTGLSNKKRYIEMNDLDSSLEENKNKNINKNYFIEKNSEEDNEQIKEEDDDNENDDGNKVEFERTFDCNYFWINNIVRDEQKIINFIKSHTKFKGDNIEELNLNTVYDFFSQENKEVFDIKEKKLKFKIQNFGIDNYVRYKTLNPNFKVVVTVLLE